MKTRYRAGKALRTAAAAVLAPVCAAASAQNASNPSQPQPPIVVTAARNDQAVTDALPATQVITREDIERSGAGDVPDLLRMLTAADVAQAGGAGKVSSVFLRGAESRHTLVLIDGVPLNKADFGSASFEHLPLALIERIEIARGNLSSLYGSQAVGGVIQIFTRTGKGISASAVVGSQNTYEAAASIGSVLGGTRLALALQHQQTAGISAQNPASFPGADPDRDGYRNDSLTASAQRTLAPGHTLGLRLAHTDARNEYDNAYASTPRPVSTHRLDSAALESRNQWTAQWQSQLNLSWLGERLDDPSNFTTQGRNRNTQLSWVNRVALPADLLLQLGVEATRSRFDDTPSSGFAPRDGRSAWLGFSGEAGAFDWQINARHDHVSDAGSAATGYAGIGYALGAGWKLIASAGSSFSAPTFTDLLYADPSQPPLRPERGRNAELGLQYAQGGVRARLTLFDSRIRDKVQFDPLTFFTSNIGRSSDRGAELSVSAALPFGRLQLEAGFHDPRNDDTGARLLRRSRENVALNYAVTQGRWSFAAYLKHVGARPDIDPVSFATVSNAAFSRTDVTLGYALSPQWSLRAKIENLFDNRRDEVLGYGTRPRGAFLTLQYRD